MTENHIDSCSQFNFLNLKENLARPRKKSQVWKTMGSIQDEERVNRFKNRKAFYTAVRHRQTPHWTN